ncbi:MAG: hypothetical protein KDB07_01490, partial [Planctomycetes bacterium]|nr:hypothetical protein [Planctomycetota bacterium]
MNTSPILLVEDNPDDALLIRHELERWEGCSEVVHALTAKEFERLLPTRRWSAVVSDYRMPKLDVQ